MASLTTNVRMQKRGLGGKIELHASENACHISVCAQHTNECFGSISLNRAEMEALYALLGSKLAKPPVLVDDVIPTDPNSMLLMARDMLDQRYISDPYAPQLVKNITAYISEVIKANSAPPQPPLAPRRVGDVMYDANAFSTADILARARKLAASIGTCEIGETEREFLATKYKDARGIDARLGGGAAEAIAGFLVRGGVLKLVKRSSNGSDINMNPLAFYVLADERTDP